MVAIVVAIAIPYYQNYTQQRQREDSALKQRLDGISATYALMNHVAETHKRLVSVFLYNRKWADPERQSVSHDLKQSAAMLREIPVTALSNEMVHFLVALREVSNFGEFIAEKLTQYPEPIILLDVVNKVKANAALIDRWMKELDLLEQDARSNS
ncbi:hypothetical protein [Pseudomonas sp. NMS19W]|uniref:hypothetical protein n=1 Tax=Pseudomonas sp. NMS19W TaxID=3079768 RepID=UPI003F65C833